MAGSKAENFVGAKSVAVPADPGVAEKLAQAPKRPETRLDLESPSAREGGGKVRLMHVISQGSGRALDRGTRIHSWLSQIEWLEGQGPEARRWVEESPDLWRGLGKEEAAEEAKEVVSRVNQGMHWVFDRGEWTKRWAAAKDLEVWREKSFAVVWEREGKQEILTGTFDRVVLARDAKGIAVGAEVVDFKTDRLEGKKETEERAEYYRPQLEAYAEAVAKLAGLAREKVTTRIAWVWGDA